jgi:hypothetical protein
VEWRRLHKKELYGMYSSPNIRVIKSVRMRLAGHLALLGDWKVAYSILVEKAEGKRPLGRPRCRWEDNMIRVLQKVGSRVRDVVTVVVGAYE